jgi:hypothetical protein
LEVDIVPYRVLMYTKGIASGHLTRVNAVHKGFVRAGYDVEFFVVAPRSKYLDHLNSGIRVMSLDALPPPVDILICDWKADDFVESLPASYSTAWIGLRRLGKIKSTFHKRFHIVAVEPTVSGDACIWPILLTWQDELRPRDELLRLVGAAEGDRVALLCENGAYAKHPPIVLDHRIDTGGFKHVRCSNSPHVAGNRDLDYYPIAQFFAAADHVVVGAGYNSVHEALCYVPPSKLTVLLVGGDDQERRMCRLEEWRQECPGDSQAGTLARYIIEHFIALGGTPQ